MKRILEVEVMRSIKHRLVLLRVRVLYLVPYVYKRWCTAKYMLRGHNA
jgi:hypothetical protein